MPEKDRMDLTPEELINTVYPIARECISPLSEIIKSNPWLAEQCLQSAILIGINQAMVRIKDDMKFEAVNKLMNPDSWVGFNK